MKIELTQTEAIRLEQFARMIEDSDVLTDDERKAIKGARRKIQGALERSGARRTEDSSWRTRVNP